MGIYVCMSCVFTTQYTNCMSCFQMTLVKYCVPGSSCFKYFTHRVYPHSFIMTLFTSQAMKDLLTVSLWRGMFYFLVIISANDSLIGFTIKLHLPAVELLTSPACFKLPISTCSSRISIVSRVCGLALVLLMILCLFVCLFVCVCLFVFCRFYSWSPGENNTTVQSAVSSRITIYCY